MTVATLEAPPAELARAVEGAVEHDVGHRAPGVGAHVLGGYGEVAGRVVDQHLGQVPVLLDGIESRRHALGAADVDLALEGAGADRLDRRHSGRAVLGAAAQDRHVRADAAELDGDRLAQAGPAARDDHDLAVEAALRQQARTQRRWLRDSHG